MPESISGALVGAERPADAHTDELDALIDKRAREAISERDRANAEQESWKQTTRIYNAAHREARKHQWVSYFKRAAANHRGLAERMEARAEEVSRLEV